jgi:putative cardiolipin synthase
VYSPKIAIIFKKPSNKEALLSMMNLTKTVALAATVVILVTCSTLPPAPLEENAFAQPPATEGPLARLAAQQSLTMNINDSAFHLIPKASDGLALRLALIDNATHSLDAQYYVWSDDAAGALMIRHILDAADRGVKVRLLVDEMNLAQASTFKGADPALAAIDFHPNLELRLFNPGQYRDGSLGVVESLASRFSSYNRRMHNKLLVADNLFAIVGGRNIGNHYFGLDAEHNFVDVDVLVTGSVIAQTSAGFDVFWNSELAYPAYALAPADEHTYAEVNKSNHQFLQEQAQLLDTFNTGDSSNLTRLSSLVTDMHRGSAVFLEKKPTDSGADNHELFDAINKLAEGDAREIFSTTPYLIPVGGFIELLEDDAKKGVRATFLTNSLASNNQPAVHSHYKNYRRKLLGAGVQLYELHHLPAGDTRRFIDTPPQRSESVVLHMKATVIDGQRCFVGTLNLDPRSIEINTEDVMYIESEGLCTELQDYMKELLTDNSAWQVTLDDKDKLQWQSYEGTTGQQPAHSFGQRIADFFYGILPEKQL